MSRASHTVLVQADIPANIPPDGVIQLLHNHLHVVMLQPLVRKVVAVPSDQIAGAYMGRAEELHFEGGSEAISHYEVTETITFIPGIGGVGRKDITFPARFQNTINGIKTWADAPSGVTVQGEWSVKPQEGKRGKWTLEEHAVVECSSWLMPFVRKSIDAAHKDMCKKLLDGFEVRAMQDGVQELPA